MLSTQNAANAHSTSFFIAASHPLDRQTILLATEVQRDDPNNYGKGDLKIKHFAKLYCLDKWNTWSEASQVLHPY